MAFKRLDNNRSILNLYNMNVLVDILSSSFWMIIAGFEFLIITYLLIIKNRKKIDPTLKGEIMNEKVDFGNLITSAFHSEKLWDELRKKCHPDRFGGDEKKIKIAGEIQAEINKNKNNVKVLQDLKIRAEKELDVKF